MRSLLAFALGGLATYYWLQRDPGRAAGSSVEPTRASTTGSAGETPRAAGSGDESPNTAERLQARGQLVSPVADGTMPTDNLVLPAPPADGDAITPGLPDLMRGA